MESARGDPFDVTVRVAGLLLRSSGEGVGMLERYVRRVSGAYGITVEVIALPEQVLITEAQSHSSSRVSVLKATPGLSRLDQVMDVKTLVDDIDAGLPVAQAAERLGALESAPQRWPPWVRVIGVILFTAGFAPSVVRTGSEVVATVLLGAVMGVLLVSFEGRRLEPLLPFAGGFLLTLIAAYAMSGLVSRTGVVLVVVPALFVVVPGDYLSASAAELISGRIAPGATRLIYAALVLALLVIGIAAAAELTGNADLLTETEVDPTLPLVAVLGAWVVFAVGLVLAFNAHPSALPWLIPTVLVTYLAQLGFTRLVGDITGTLVAGIMLGTIAGLATRFPGRPPRLVIILGGFFVLTVGGLGLRGATALLGNDAFSGLADLRDFFIQMPAVAIALSLPLLATSGGTPKRAEP